MTSEEPLRPMLDLSGVPETALITLYNRAAEAARPDGVIRDPLAVALVQSETHALRARFGAPDQAHALRARQFDAEVTAFLDAHPGASVVSLGEGLETQFWRAGRRAGRWVSVDLADMIHARECLLPSDPRNLLIPGSAWDAPWMEHIPHGVPVLIIVQGLLMYFPASEVESLLGTLAQVHPGARLLFDTIPSWAATTTRGHRASSGYRLPAQPWGTSRRALDRMLRRVGIREWNTMPAIAGRGLFWRHIHPTLSRTLPGALPMAITAQLPGKDTAPHGPAAPTPAG
ncbi:class I SAM-dependent methyltransferase [Gryllotalpicola reticulitermitis]|uniref:Class I SAM-dependent methyltransferase n=1 Tax=Gryllotalpicola reticulitermitis TaxID=1184153 RepID=A0ABV8Q327_9MICO